MPKLKPEKRKLGKSPIYIQYDKGYNHCYDEYEAFLPSEGEIIKIISDTLVNVNEGKGWICEQLAKAISKRIRGA